MHHEDTSGIKDSEEKARSMTYRDRADDISNLWQISIHNISSLFLRRKHKRIAEPYKKNSLWIANEKRDEENKNKECCNCLRCTQIDCQIGASLLKTKTTKTVRPKESASFLNALLIYLPQPSMKASQRLYGIETLQNKAIRYLFNLIHNSSSTLSPYNVRGKQIKMKWKRWVCAFSRSMSITSFISLLWMMIWCWFNLSNANFIQYNFLHHSTSNIYDL